MSTLLSLTEEHHTISELLAALQTYATRLRGGASVDPADLGRFAEVLRELVDYRHHEKEEGILMPLLARNGFDWSTGLLAELRHEHGHLRHLLDVFCQAAARGSLGNGEQRRQLVEVALAFVEYEREHMRKEDELLLPAIQARLGALALEQLDAELARFDRPVTRDSGAGFAAVAEELVQRYSVDSATIDVTGLRWTPAGSVLEAARAAAEIGGRARPAVTSFGRSR